MPVLAGRSAVVRPRGGAHLTGVIESGDGARVTVVLPVVPPRPFGGLDAVLEYASPLGVHRVHGVLATDPARAEVLHLTRDGGEVVQRREWVRVDAALPVTLTAAGTVARVYTRNLSAGGMLVQDPLGVALGDEVRFALRLADGEPPLVGQGPATSVRPGEGLVAVRFDSIAEGDRERIVRWAVARQRHELRLRSGA